MSNSQIFFHFVQRFSIHWLVKSIICRARFIATNVKFLQEKYSKINPFFNFV